MSDTPLDPGEEDPTLEETPTDDGDDEETARARHLVFAARYRAIHCASCDTIISDGPAVCAACLEAGYCAVCGFEHRTWQCPQIVRVRHEMAAQERALHREMVTTWARGLQAQYEADPIAA